LEELDEVDRMRRAYQEMTAKCLMTLDDLSAGLDQIENTRATALRELAAIEDRRERVEELERERDALLEAYAGATPEVLEGLEPVERHRVYRMLRLEVLVGLDGSLNGSIANGLPGAAVLGLAEWDRRPGEPVGSLLRAPHLVDPQESVEARRT
jgi:hypothetical protein